MHACPDREVHTYSPELGGDGRGRGEVGQLLADAGEEEPREAVAVDGRDAGRPHPADEPEADDAQVPPQPVPGKPGDRARTTYGGSAVSQRARNKKLDQCQLTSCR
jgi:hypothetical protein